MNLRFVITEFPSPLSSLQSNKLSQWSGIGRECLVEEVVVLMANDKQAKDELLTELRAADETLYRCWRVAPVQSGVAALIDYAQKRVQEAIGIRRGPHD